jgi:hypothetical protein
LAIPPDISLCPKVSNKWQPIQRFSYCAWGCFREFEFGKHAFPGDRAGPIAVTSSSGSGIELSVSDNGVGLGEGEEPGGLGARIVQLLAQQLEGETSYERLDPGLRVRVRAHPR